MGVPKMILENIVLVFDTHTEKHSQCVSDSILPNIFRIHPTIRDTNDNPASVLKRPMCPETCTLKDSSNTTNAIMASSSIGPKKRPQSVA